MSTEGKPRRRLAALALLAALATGGCATANLSPELASFGGGQVNPAGANTLIRFAAPRVTAADLAAQICPANGQAYRTAAAASKAGAGTARAAAADDPLSDAVACFGALAEANPADTGLKLRRNGVTTYLLLRSDQACNLWVTYARRPRPGSANMAASACRSLPACPPSGSAIGGSPGWAAKAGGSASPARSSGGLRTSC